MTSPALPTSATAVRPQQAPLRVLWFVLLCTFDGLILLACVLQAANIVLGTSIGNFSEWTVQLWGTVYTLDPPTFPWVVGPLSALSLVAGFQAARGRRFALVVAIGFAWVALGIVAIATGSGSGCWLSGSCRSCS